MILGPVSYIDCLVFLVFLAPQLVIHVGLWTTATWVLQALPFLREENGKRLHYPVVKLPLQFLWTRYLTPRSDRPPFVRASSPFQDVVIRCVRYAFAHMAPAMGRTFLSAPVALPFLRWRMLRHGYFPPRLPFRTVPRPQLGYSLLHIDSSWAAGEAGTHDDPAAPDLVVLYAHGGGFSMGSAAFYLEFLLAWQQLLRDSGAFARPAMLAPDYALAPAAAYPRPVAQTLDAYGCALRLAGGDAARVVVAGDSAGGTLVLSALLHRASSAPSSSSSSSSRSSAPDDEDEDEDNVLAPAPLPRPALAVLVSPWVSVLSPANASTPSDYLTARALRRYGALYLAASGAAARASPDARASPGSPRNGAALWRRAAPRRGWVLTAGADEVLGPEVRRLGRVLDGAGAGRVELLDGVGVVHAWPVAAVFLGRDEGERLGGLREIVRAMVGRFG
ncbi:Alpha/Beta hydrolase protein, partial [Lineolata rhizophorae]